MKLTDLAVGLTNDDLRSLTHEMVDTLQGMLSDCTDADVIFQPVDPNAKDDAAATEAERTIPWTLGHLVVHTTASSEEAKPHFWPQRWRAVCRITVARVTKRIGRPLPRLSNVANGWKKADECGLQHLTHGPISLTSTCCMNLIPLPDSAIAMPNSSVDCRMTTAT